MPTVEENVIMFTWRSLSERLEAMCQHRKGTSIRKQHLP